MAQQMLTRLGGKCKRTAARSALRLIPVRLGIWLGKRSALGFAVIMLLGITAEHITLAEVLERAQN